jgi:hypothetical protein
MDYACPTRMSAARTHVRKLHVLKSKCIHLATGPHWYVSNRQIHEYMGVPLLAEDIRAQSVSFE